MMIAFERIKELNDDCFREDQNQLDLIKRNAKEQSVSGRFDQQIIIV